MLQLAAQGYQNQIRKWHDAQPLKIDKKLCARARKYAKAIGNKVPPSDAIPELGRNIAIKCSGARFTAGEAVKFW